MHDAADAGLSSRLAKSKRKGPKASCPGRFHALVAPVANSHFEQAEESISNGSGRKYIFIVVGGSDRASIALGTTPLNTGRAFTCWQGCVTDVAVLMPHSTILAGERSLSIARVAAFPTPEGPIGPLAPTC